MKIEITKSENGFYKIHSDDSQWIVKKLKESDDSNEIQIVSISDTSVIVSVSDIDVIRNCFDCGRHEVVFMSVSNFHILKVWGTIFEVVYFNIPLKRVEELEKIKELTVIVSSFDKVVVSGDSSKFPLDKLEKMINC